MPSHPAHSTQRPNRPERSTHGGATTLGRVQQVMAVTFEKHGQLHYVDPAGHRINVGDHVLVPTEEGPEVAQCVWAPEGVLQGDFGELPACVGLASAADLARDKVNRKFRSQARVVVNRLVREHELPMKIVGIDYVDRHKEYHREVVVYFTAPHRVDFRLLVRDLVKALQARIDLRQIGARDATRITGGIGNCGRDLCCSTHLTRFEPVSMRLAKDQDLPSNPLRVQGACGRLMCCLKYEHPLYQDFVKKAPKIGSRVKTPEGEGKVIGHSVPSDSVVVRVDGTGEVTRCPQADVCPARRAFDTRPS